jgi:hypothetical protein
MHLIGRRNFLAGLGLGAGSVLLGSMFRQLLPEALGQPLVKKRWFGYIKRFSQNPIFLPSAGPGGDIQLPPALAALEPFKKDLLYVDKFHNPFDKWLHHNSSPFCVIKTGRGQYDPPDGLSFDRFLAQEIGKGDAHPSINVAPVWTSTWEGFSADGKGRPFPAEGNPIKAFDKLFAGQVSTAMPGAGVEERLAREKSILDYLRAEVARMNGRLAAPERAKLDQMLDAIRGVETRLAALKDTPASCTPKALGALPALDGRVADPMWFAAAIEVATTAVICGITRVAMLGHTAAEYKFIGSGVGNHDPWYHDVWRGRQLDTGLKYFQFHAQQVAAIRKRLEAVPEGDGTMADSSVIMWFDVGGHFQHHSGVIDSLWLLTVGSGRGALKTGKVIRYPNGQRAINDALITVAQAVGVPAGKTFGDPSIMKGPLTEALA